MPGGLTGVDVAEQMRAVHPQLPVVYVTGYSASVLDPSQLDGSTPTSLLNKPFSESDLLEIVNTAIGVPA